MRAPDDVTEAARLLDQGAFRAEHVVAVLGKTEGNSGGGNLAGIAEQFVEHPVDAPIEGRDRDGGSLRA